MIKNQKLNKGFTLIELLIVIVIIGILATFLMVNFVGVRQRARDAQRKSDLRQIQSALELFRSDSTQGSYPATETVNNTCGGELSDGTNVYMKSIPCDPLSTESEKIYYSYDSDGSGGYSLTACLENENDPQLDKDGSGEPIACGSGGYSYTLQNP